MRKNLDVTTILLEVVPGDGSGHEVYARSVDDVTALLTKNADRIEELESELNLFTTSVRKREAVLAKENAELRALVQEFCDRVDRGEVRSKTTYAKFKAALARSTDKADTAK